MKCPCCGQAMPDTPIVFDAQQRAVSDGLRVVRLGPSRFKLLAIMWQKRPYSLSVYELSSQLYADDINGGPDDPNTVVRTQICHLKKQVAPLGIKICSTMGQGAVYQISHVARS